MDHLLDSLRKFLEMCLKDGFKSCFFRRRWSETKILQLRLDFRWEGIPCAGQKFIGGLVGHALLEQLELVKTRRFVQELIGTSMPTVCWLVGSALSLPFADSGSW